MSAFMAVIAVTPGLRIGIVIYKEAAEIVKTQNSSYKPISHPHR